jgi:hypothetical protein
VIVLAGWPHPVHFVKMIRGGIEHDKRI